MGDTGEASTDAMVGSHLGMVANRAHVKAISWRRILVLVASCFWFCITASLAFTIRLMTRWLFRTKRDEDSYQRGDSDFSPAQAPERIIEASKSEEQDDLDASEGEEAPPVFQFRFSFQVPEESLSGREELQGNSDGEDAVPSMTTSIVSNYRVLSERDFSGFLEAPQAMTMCVQESYAGSDGAVLETTGELDGELRARFSTLKCSQGTDSDAGETVCEGGDLNKSLHPDKHEPGNTKELDTELSNRLSCLKGEAGHGGAACRSWDSDGVIRENTEKLDRELKARLSDVKFPCESHAAEGAAVHGDREVCPGSWSDGDALDDTEELDRELTARFLSVRSSNSDGGAAVSNCPGGLSSGTLCEDEPEELEPVIQLDHKTQLQSASLPFEACSPAGACSPPGKGAGGFDSDVASESTSDGYSVKDLNMDFDSDGFLSERDFEPEIDKESLFDLDGENEEFLKCDQELEHTQLPNLRGFDTGSSVVFGGGDVEFAQDMSNSTDPNHMTMHNPVSPSVLHDDVLPDGEAEFDIGQEPGTPSSRSSGIRVEQNGRVAKAAPSQTAHTRNSETPDGLVNSDHLGGSPDEQAQRWEDPLKEVHFHQEDSHHSEVTHLSEPKELNMEETEELESLWEHQDLIDQLKMELRKVRSIGLPTILEESESPKPTEDLKPWKFDAKFLHEDPMDELNKFYKSYRERMRKLDILNYQKMYAVGFLQLNDPLQSMCTQKPFIPAITSLLSQNIWPRRRKSGGGDPSEKFVKELQSDLETVYVGQSCLSWEFLRWQYERTRESLDTDRRDGRRYNQVAGEFQQFQVLIQRFLEEEPFQGTPRVLNYAKNRCVIRSLLQVPVVREDCSEEEVEGESRWEGAVTRAQLECAMERSIRIFWEFVKKADKDDGATPAAMRKGLMGSHSHVELQGPADRELMLDVQADLQKKEKKLKDTMRVGNCLVKKLQKPARDGGRVQEDDHHLFSSQVDLKLVSRVLKMTRITTDQLVWCHKKLSRITFVDRKLMREPSFSLFPC